MSATNEESQSASKSPGGEEAQPTAMAGAVAAAPVPTTRTFLDIFRGADLGFVPVLVTLAIIVVVFEILSGGDFLTARNISNLSDQIVTVGTVGIAAMLVLLLGEIDLSLAAVSQCCGGIMAVLLVRQDIPAPLAILGAILAGAFIGLINGLFIAVLRIPSFIVTLAGSIAYSGILLLVLQPQTTLQIRDRGILDINATHYADAVMGYAVPLIGVAIYALALFYNRIRRVRAGLKVGSIGGLIARIVILTLVMIGAIAIFQSNEFNGGIPQSFFIWICLIIIFWLILTQTSFGRHVYAVGGNAEASRRAGINVIGLRIAIFTLASSLAAVAGILQVSRGTGADSQINPTLLLNAIAAAVVGGVSLFGGRGSIWAVVLGAIIIGGLENGLNLLGQGQEIREIVEGAVLVLAVTVDALIRRQGILGYLRNEKRPRQISIVCAIIAVNIVISIITIFIGLVTGGTVAPGWFWIVALVNLGLAVAGLLGLLQMKKWGAYAYTGSVVLGIVTLLVLGGLGIISLILPVIMLVLIYRHFSEMS